MKKGQTRIENFYLKAGYIFAGYSSTFVSGINWEKSAWWPLVGCGYEFKYVDVYATYYPKEHQTVNEVEAFKIGTSINLYYGWGIMIEGSHQTWDQNGKRDSDQLITTGIFYRF